MTDYSAYSVPVLDKGFVKMQDMMGGDWAVLDAARVSYRSSSKGEEADKKLIRYLLKNHHGTPFEHVVLKFHVKLPIFVARQWIRHRTSSYNEVSARYTEMSEEFYLPKTWRAQDTKNRQGSVESPEVNQEHCHAILRQSSQMSMESYRLLLAAGVAKEMARFALPVNLYTEWIWTPNARALLNFLTLRCDSHAQWETRQYAYALSWIMRQVMPWTFEAWEDSIPEGERLGYQGMRDHLSYLDSVAVGVVVP